MGNIGEGTAVHKSGRAFKGLYEIRSDGVLQQSGHGTLCLEIGSGDRTVIKGIADNNAAQTFLEVGQGSGEAEDRHDFRGNGDVKPVFSRRAVGFSAHAVDNKAELTVIHIHAALPGDAANVNAQFIALLDMVVEHGGKQVVCSADGVEVTGEMQVNILHGDNLCITAAGCTALDAEHRAKARFTQRADGFLADAAQAVGQANGGCGLAFAGRGGGHGCDQNQLGFSSGVADQSRINLGLITAIGLKGFFRNVCFFGNLSNGQHFTLLSNFDICRHSCYLPQA